MPSSPTWNSAGTAVSARYAFAGRPDWREWGGGQAPQPPHLQLEASRLQLTRLWWGGGAADRWSGNTPARSQGPQGLVLAQRLSKWVTLGGSLQCQVGSEMPPDERGSRDSWGSSRCLGGGSPGPLFCGQAACSGDHRGHCPELGECLFPVRTYLEWAQVQFQPPSSPGTQRRRTPSGASHRPRGPAS